LNVNLRCNSNTLREISVGESGYSYEEDFEDLSYNADLYVFNDQMIEGCRGVNINTRENEEPLD